MMLPGPVLTRKDPSPRILLLSPVADTPNFSPRELVNVRAPPAVPLTVMPAAIKVALVVTWLVRSVKAKAVVVEAESKVRSTGLVRPAPVIRTVTLVGVNPPAVLVPPTTVVDMAVPVVPERLPRRALARRSPAST